MESRFLLLLNELNKPTKSLVLSRNESRIFLLRKLKFHSEKSSTDRES